MRMIALMGWLMIPVLLGAYHYGPGQDGLRMDQIADALDVADTAATEGRWADAAEGYDQALAELPKDQADEAARIRLERDKAWMMAAKLPEARVDLEALVEELEADENADPALLDESREALAQSLFYLTWLMRLEGEGREAWEPEIESARQTYRLLAERAEAEADDQAATRHKEDLEGAIRLARMDLSELQGLAIPSQCQGCCSGQCNSKGKKPSQNRSQSPKDARGASSGPPPDGVGS